MVDQLKTKTIKTGIIIDPKTKKQKITTTSKLELDKNNKPVRSGEFDVPEFKTKEMKIRQKEIVETIPGYRII